MLIFELPHAGDEIEFAYPRRNRLGRGLHLVRRRVKVVAIEDAAKISIALGAFLRRPLVRRGRWRCIAWDPQALAERTFYLDWATPVRLQLGRYNPITGGDWEPISSPFMQCRSDINELISIGRELIKNPPRRSDVAFGLRAVS